MSHLPTTDLDFLLTRMRQCDKLIAESEQQIGYTSSFVRKGDKPMHKRFVSVSSNKDKLVNYNQASALAIEFQFMGELLNWLLANRGWKEGAYIVQEVEEENEEE